MMEIVYVKYELLIASARKCSSRYICLAGHQMID